MFKRTKKIDYDTWWVYVYQRKKCSKVAQTLYKDSKRYNEDARPSTSTTD